MSAASFRERPVPPGFAAGAPVPWWIKLGVKLVIGTLPVPPRAWRALGLRRHSFSASESRRLVPPLAHAVRRATALMGRAPRSLLEIGPGAMVRRAPIAAALGLGAILYLDIEDDAPHDLAPYRLAAEAARKAGLAPPDLSGCATREDVLAACNARLLLGGSELLQALPAGSVDLVFSEVVLEHVRRDAMSPLLSALRRVTAPDGVGLHAVDFHDHLGGALRQLAFSPRFWESRAVDRAALYNNRLGLSEMLEEFARAGFEAAAPERLVWQRPPLPATGIHPALARRAEDNRVCRAEIEARPA
jgi:SAM-dependent methyltransferase